MLEGARSLRRNSHEEFGSKSPIGIASAVLPGVGSVQLGVKVGRKVATPSEDEFLADDRVIDAYVRAWLGPVALLTIGLRVVVASVQEDQGPRSSTGRAVRTTLRAPQLGSTAKQPGGAAPAERNGRGRSPGRHKDDMQGAVTPGRSERFRSAMAKLTARARWFS